MLNLVWFRNDLRTYDNPALYQAMAKGDTLAVYCLSDKQWDQHGLAPIQRRLTVDHLLELEEQLAKLNVPLKVIDCERFTNVPSHLVQLCNEHKVTSVFYNHQYEVNEKTCTEETLSQLGDLNITAHGYHDQCVIAPGEIVNGSGECYKVFSAFFKNWSANLQRLARPLYSAPDAQAPIDISSDIACLKNYLIDTLSTDPWPTGEDEAHDRLNVFIEQDVKRYKEQRDFPDIDATSQLSVYLALGVLTTRQCLQALLGGKTLAGTTESGHSPGLAITALGSLNEGETCWMSELVWRDFYRNILVAFPRVSKGKPFTEITDNLPWNKDPKVFQAWCDGKTGIPIVDAAMRQLNTTGWMHNLSLIHI